MTTVAESLRAARELYRRQCDGIEMFRAISPEMPGADSNWPDQVSAFKSTAREILSTGGNQSGKSTWLAIKFAAMARDKSVTMWDGERVDLRRPWQKNRPLLMWAVGLQLNHLKTMYNMLFGFGLYQMIPDEVTGIMRPWRPWLPRDLERQAECKPSWPLIPPEEIDQKGWAWYNKANREFQTCRLKNGTEIWGLASTSDYPKQGDKVDVIWPDEQINDASHYTEWLMRIAAKRGIIGWSAYMSEANEAIMQIVEAADEDKERVARGEKEKPDVEVFTFRYSGNPFIHPESKRHIQERLTPEELERRDLGLDSRGRTLIYPFFSRSIHAAIPYDPALDDEIAKILRANNGVPPANWTHDLILDPGTVKPGLLLGAVPPPELWGGPLPVLVAYREIYDGRMTAADIARKAHAAIPPGVWLYRKIIDGQAGRQTSLGRAESTSQHYASEFQKMNISCQESGYAFIPSVPDFAVRRMKVDQVLQQNGSGKPRLRIVLENCPNLVRQMETNRLAVAVGSVLEKEAARQKDDMRVCLEYWVALDPVYVPPKAQQHTFEKMWESFQKHFFQRHGTGQKEQPDRVHIGPGTAA